MRSPNQKQASSRLSNSTSAIRQVSKTGGTKRKHFSGPISNDNDTSLQTPRSMLQSFISNAQVEESEPKRPRLDPPPRPPPPRFSPSKSLRSAPEGGRTPGSPSRSPRRGLSTSLSASPRSRRRSVDLRKKATMKSFLQKEEAERPTPRTMLAGFIDQGLEESMIASQPLTRDVNNTTYSGEITTMADFDASNVTSVEESYLSHYTQSQGSQNVKRPSPKPAKFRNRTRTPVLESYTSSLNKSLAKHRKPTASSSFDLDSIHEDAEELDVTKTKTPTSAARRSSRPKRSLAGAEDTDSEEDSRHAPRRHLADTTHEMVLSVSKTQVVDVMIHSPKSLSPVAIETGQDEEEEIIPDSQPLDSAPQRSSEGQDEGDAPEDSPEDDDEADGEDQNEATLRDRSQRRSLRSPDGARGPVTVYDDSPPLSQSRDRISPPSEPEESDSDLRDHEGYLSSMASPSRRRSSRVTPTGHPLSASLLRASTRTASPRKSLSSSVPGTSPRKSLSSRVPGTTPRKSLSSSVPGTSPRKSLSSSVPGTSPRKSLGVSPRKSLSTSMSVTSGRRSSRRASLAASVSISRGEDVGEGTPDTSRRKTRDRLTPGSIGRGANAGTQRENIAVVTPNISSTTRKSKGQTPTGSPSTSLRTSRRSSHLQEGNSTPSRTPGGADTSARTLGGATPALDDVIDSLGIYEEDEESEEQSTLVQLRTPHVQDGTPRITAYFRSNQHPDPVLTPPRPKPKPGRKAGAAPVTRTSQKSPAAPRLPTSVVKSWVQQFAGGRVPKETLVIIEDMSEQFFKDAADSLEAYAHHAGRQTITEEDVELLMTRQRFIDNKTSLFSLVEKYLPLERRKEIIPCAFAGNKIYP